MWIKDSNTGKWKRDTEELNKDIYNLLRQELDKMRFYRKCFDGTSYLPINNLDDIYDKIKFVNDESWYIGSTTYSVPATGDNEITSSTQEKYSEYILEDGMTLKNLFTDQRVINSSIDNYLEVDLISTEEIGDLTGEKKGLFIDGVRVLEGHRILIKDQQTFVTLGNNVDPNSFFQGNYYVVDEDVTTTDYFYYNESNGIYVFRNNRLVRTDELDNYETNMRYSVVAKLGQENFDRQFHLSRLLNGYYPKTSNNEPIEFLEKHNWVLRNQVEYQNVLETNYNDVLKHDVQSFGSYSIPQRTVAVGDFGSIINNQNDISSVIKNKFKDDLKGIDEVEGYYWMCGQEGSLLKVSKINFSVESIVLDTFHTLNSISFFNNNRGVAVGDYNTIYYTFNGGNTWKKLDIQGYEDFIYNKVIYYSLDTIYIVGNNGVFLELIFNSGQWTVNKRRPLKRVDANDEFFVVDNMRDIIKTDFSTWNLTYGYTSSTIQSDKDALMVLGDNNTLFFYDVNNFLPGDDYLFLSFDNNNNINDLGNLKTGIKRNDDIYVYSENKLETYSFDINDFSVINEDSNVIFATSSLLPNVSSLDGDYNSFYNYNNDELILAGDNSTLKGYTYSLTPYDLDPTFGVNFNSKMLFLDYDIASKLNFFDNDSEYRLPENFYYELSPSLGTSLLAIESKANELSWIDYMKDENKVFRYNTALTTPNEVLMSTTFSSYATGGSASNKVIISDGDYITNELSDIQNLAPSFISPTASISAPTSSYGLYLYRNLMILKTDTSVTPAFEGEVFAMDSNLISGEFVANRIEDFGTDRYIYFYSRFNENITNDLNIISGSVSFTNLNRFPLNDTKSLEEQFNRHPISDGYKMSFLENVDVSTDAIQIDAIFNEKTAYYNLQANIEFEGTVNTTSNMDYRNSFLDFGYSATYNIESYLSNINPSVFTSGKIFGAMPVYNGFPYGNAGINIDKNHIVFNPGYKFEYDTFWKNTFIDVTIYGDTTESTEKALILKKYYDESIDRYIIELSKEINEPGNPTSVDISSRRTLSQISSDLRELNNIHKGEKEISYGSNLFYNLENELNFKFNTESYSKILLSDGDIKKNLSALLYFDSKNQLSLNIIDLGEQVDLEIKDIKNSFGNVEFWSFKPHKLSVGDYVYVRDTDNVYSGIHIVKTVINKNKFVSESAWIGPATALGTMRHFIYDEYLNYEPTDIIDVGIDKKGKIAVDIQPENIQENEDETVSLINLNLSKYKFKLIDNLSIIDINESYKWILEAELEDALIGQDEEGNLQWYKGIWHCGRWFGGKWYSGIWREGQWYDGEWYSVEVKSNPIKATPNLSASDKSLSVWYNGDWRGGTWYDGTHHNGTWYDGEWRNGLWTNGQFNQGQWLNGEFSGGTWVLGTWLNGKFNCDSDLSIWVDGSWNGGDFECGIWKNGQFNQRNGNISRFGTRSTNSRKSIWETGTWFMGEFHSQLNTDNDGNTLESENHKYSIWQTGTWNNGSWYGGTAFLMNWNSGTWYNGVLREVEIVGLLSDNVIPSPELTDSRILLKGLWNFNRNESLWVIDNQNGFEPILGTNDNIGNYLVKNVNQIEATQPGEEDLTEVFVYKDLTSVTSFGYTYSAIPPNVGWEPNPVTSQHSLVSYLQKADWKSGLWQNGIFDGDYYRGGMWMNGVFLSGNWT